ncbi:pyrroline-5-carboxylate reductase [Thiolapillus brandeum]|uniref:Pyrroline-5-carboxylate reductase n=1 Tax=Thiolapillus brandeum TaxID=1076588 RepID=A0A7U6GKU0_9GAMM|nr:pyrroline-5-carboxylate reductase [Thiolapillus brandeum]BAO45511.1 pyrroline-5-carboxylate reductase [Thiolapillus brandeum]
MNTKTLAFIGGGNMASAMINGLIEDGTEPSHILVAEPDETRREQLAARFGVHTLSDNSEAAHQADVLILAVKPQALKTVAKGLSPALQQHTPLCLSIAAGIRHASLQAWLGQDVPVIRVMPNTPAMLGAGASGLYAPGNIDAAQREVAEHIMRATGIAVWLEDESLMDALTAVSGSGPAYFFRFMEAMETTAQELGLSEKTAHLLVLQTALGAARMAMESTAPLKELRSSVTSPGGTTEAALKVFTEGGLAQLVQQALTAARDRSIELSDSLGGDE